MRKAPSHRFSPTSTLTGAALLALLGAVALGALGVSGAGAYVVPAGNPNGTIAEGDDDSYGTAVCMVTGAAGTAASPVDSRLHDSTDDDEAFDPQNMSDTDGGTFLFDSATVACAGEDEGGEVIGTLADDDFKIFAGENSRVGESEYTNFVCGTGHAEGTADLYGGTNSDGSQNETNLKTSFSISFVGGIGPLAITGFEGVVDLGPRPDPLANPPRLTGSVAPTGQGDLDETDGTEIDHVQDVDTGHGVGVVQITPKRAAMPAPANAANPDGNTDDDAGGNPPDGDTMPGAGTHPCVDEDVEAFDVASAFAATLSGDTDNTNYDENEDVPAT